MKKLAIFCPVKDETTFSQIWLDYYSKYIPKEDIYFLDFGSTSGIIGNRIHTDKNILDSIELFEEIKRFHAELLKEYEYVIPTDVDEIIFHKDGLDKYVENLKGIATCTGYEIINMPHEAKFNPSKGILEQRNYWFRSKMYYDKTLIANRPLNWSIGLHSCENSPPNDPELVLIHLHRFDFDICKERHERFAKLKWSENTIRNGHNWHYRQPDITNWFYQTDGPIVETPSFIKQILNI